ncbi:MAG: hypothetical protein WCO52_05085 [bacterium]
MKHTPLSLISALLILCLPLSAQAIYRPVEATARPDTVAVHVAAIQARGDANITARTTSLSGLKTKIAAAKRLSASQKASLTTEIEAQITGLTALKASLDADTTVETARTDFQKIFSQHFIYAFYVPRVNRIIAADEQVQAAAVLTTLTPKLQTYITTAKTAGTDVTSLQVKLDEMLAKTAEAKTLAQGVINTLTPLTAAGYPDNKSTVEASATSLRTARADLKTSRDDAHSIVTALRKALNTVQ